MLKRWCVYLLALLGLLVLYLAYQQWLAWIILVGYLVLPIFSLIVSLPAILTVRLSLENRGGIPVGTPVSLRATVQSPFPVPVYRCRVQVTNVLTEESYLLEPGDPLPTDHCGMLWLDPNRCCVYDCLGLFSFPIRYAAASQLILRPAEKPTKTPKELQQHLARSWQPKPGGGFSEHHEIRLYRPGDSMNQIHWKLTAKTGKLMIREAMEPARGRVILSVDLNGTPEILDRKMEQLQAMGLSLLEQNLPFQLHAMTGDGKLHWPVDSRQAWTNVIDELLGCDPCQEDSVADLPMAALWRYHIGGEPDEA